MTGGGVGRNEGVLQRKYSSGPISDVFMIEQCRKDQNKGQGGKNCDFCATVLSPENHTGQCQLSMYDYNQGLN